MRVFMMRKKSHPIFSVPNYGAKKRSRVKPRWRKQRGIDNKKRIKKSFMGAEPTIGYGNPAAIKGIRANGKRTILVGSETELRKLMGSGAKDFDVTLRKGLSSRKRAVLCGIAGKAGISVTNGA